MEGGDLHFEGGDLRRTLAFLELLVGAKKNSGQLDLRGLSYGRAKMVTVRQFLSNFSLLAGFPPSMFKRS